MRRGTLIVIVALFTLLLVATVYQVLAAHGPRRYPGPGYTVAPSPTAAVR